MKMRHWLAPLMMGTALVLGGSSAAEADPPPGTPAQLMVLYATQADAGAIAQGILDEDKCRQLHMVEKLGQPPFSAYNHYDLVDKRDLTLAKAQAQDVALANGRKLTVTFMDKTDDGRFRVSSAITDASGKANTVTVATPGGQPVYVAGPGYQQGVLVLVLTVQPPPCRK